jgi:hypothetical protein
MTHFLVSPQTVCEIPGFDPKDDILVVALPEDADGGLDHAVSFRRLRTHPGKPPVLEMGLTHFASGAKFRIRLPGVVRLPSAAIAVLSLSDARNLNPSSRPDDSATLTGEGLYPSRSRAKTAAAETPRKMALVHAHNWHIDGPPSERFFDLSNPESELSITLREDTGGPIYAIRLSETRKEDKGAGDVHRSIVLAQTAPGTPALSSGLLAQWVSDRLGSPDFRAIAWVWLGSEGHYTDPATGRHTPFGRINQSPQLAIHGKITGSIAIER